MFHLLAWGATTAAAAGTNDLTAFIDAEFSQRNSHYLFSEQYYMIAAAEYGVEATNAFLLSPTLNAITQFAIWPINVSKTSASPPRMDFWFKSPVPLPQNEEIQFEQVQTAAVADQVTGLMWIATQGWTPKIPVGLPPIPVFDVAITFTPTLVLNAWSTPALMTLAQNLRGGTYAVVGAEFEGANVVACRIIFPQAFIYQGRRLRPGTVASNALGDLPSVYGSVGPLVFGQWGQFTTAELPMIEATGAVAGAVACVGRLRLVRVSESININYQGQSYAGPSGGVAVGG
jgi:hypothetical protein